MRIALKTGRIKGNFLCNSHVAWPIRNREVAELYRTHVYKPPEGWKYRRSIIAESALMPAGFYFLAASQKTRKPKKTEEIEPK